MTTPTMENEPTAVPVENHPLEEGQSAPGTAAPGTATDGKHTWVEEFEIAGSQLVERVKEAVAEGNVRRLIIRNSDDKVMLEIPLTAGVVVGGVVTLFAPLLAALGALAALLARVKVQIIRTEE
ncbi:MAG: DUF4342 domain-containing protein [Caldilineaceae bacterium]